MHRARRVLIVTIASILLAGGAPWLYALPASLTPTTFVDLAKAQRPVVVSISIIQLSTTAPRQLPQGHPLPPPEEDPSTFRSQIVGTGLLISRDGHVLTNNHVIDRSERVIVTLWDGEEFEATVIGRDAKSDLALLRLTPADGQRDSFPSATLGDSDAVQVGEWVAAIGNPLGLNQTLTIGILSGKGRALGASPYEEYLQTDASINPGSSGGPLFNIKGEVIGLTTAINPSGQGIGFAIPINQVKRLLPQLMDGKVRRGWIGVMIRSNTKSPQPNTSTRRLSGVVVTDVLDDSPAAQAGVQRGDIIIEFDGGIIEQLRDLPRRVASTRVGKHATVKLYRGDQLLTMTITVDELKN